MDFFKAIPLKDGIEMLENILTVPTERIALSEAFGRIVAKDILSPETVPSFTRSTVDGYAVRSANTLGASDGTPLSG